MIDAVTIINFLEDRYITDPSEELPPRDEAEQEIQKHISEGTFHNRVDSIKKRIDDLLKKHKNKHRVYSMSLKTDNNLKIENPLENLKMWAHYADSFKGICIEYNLGKLMRSVNNLNPGYLRKQKPIDYVSKDQLPSIRLNSLLTDLIADERVIQEKMEEIYCTKNSAWAEENEIRILSNTIGIHKFEPNSISKIYYSSLCSSNIIPSITPYCNENEINLIKVSFENKSYSLKFEEV